MVVITERLARRIALPPGADLAVVPCYVDTTLFNPLGEAAPEVVRQPEGRPVLVYSGSIGTWYLLDEMLAFSARAARRRPDLHLLALSPSDHERIRAAAHDHGIRPELLTIRRDHYQNVARYLRTRAAGIAFIRRVASKDGSSPERCVATARRRFDLESVGVERYGALYRRLDAA